MASSFRIGDWRVRPRLNSLEKNSESHPLEPRAMEVLVYLAEHTEEVISKDQLIQDVWEGAFVTDEVLTYAVHQIRKALGDDAKEPRFIQTIPKRGYRLVAAVSWGEGRHVTGEGPVSPYPGLAPFSEEDAKFFFGRDEEVEAVWKKLRGLYLLGIIGPSGAGKTSFLRAGLIPSRPEGWRIAVCHPGDRPFVALGQALVPELSGDTEITQQLFRLDEEEVAASVLTRWRQSQAEVLLIVDQFEELFTLNPEEVQERFAELLGRAADEVSVHVLLSMRDDFFVHCQLHPWLSPIFKDVTAIMPLVGPALRQALVAPAERLDYRFEDESLVADMLAEVAKERGALPLLAFSASRLWAKRNREKKLLTREAYLEIGGVAGAIAQHAEATLERIGTEREPIVREIFRNLVTAKGTRAARDKEELLSVFEDRDAAEVVLSALIDARLLTSFEIAAEKKSRHSVEIIHESLLTAWPRLVRWQTQDADSAQLRDQLRQAVQLWQERG